MLMLDTALNFYIHVKCITYHITAQTYPSHDDVMTWKPFLHYCIRFEENPTIEPISKEQ